MSFTIKCNECGQEQEFKQDDNWHGDKIDIDVDANYGYTGCSVDEVSIYCENPKCNHYIEMNQRR